MDGRELPKDILPFLTAATMAGIAFGNAGCAAVHALSYPIGGKYHVPHGKANYMVFAGVFTAYLRKGADLGDLENVLKDSLGTTANTWDELFALLERILDSSLCLSLGLMSRSARRWRSQLFRINRGF